MSNPGLAPLICSLRLLPLSPILENLPAFCARANGSRTDRESVRRVLHQPRPPITISPPFPASYTALESAPAPENAREPTEDGLLAEKVLQELLELLEYHRTHRPQNTAKAYAPKQNELTESLSASTASSWMSRSYDKSGIQSSKINHIRVSECKGAEENGVPEAQVNISPLLPRVFLHPSAPSTLLTVLQIRRGGLWNADHMTVCYLKALPREFMRGIGRL